MDLLERSRDSTRQSCSHGQTNSNVDDYDDMDSDMLTDITLDHLPDLSDASLSFQIPAHIPSADLLLADDFYLDDDPSFVSLPRGPTLSLDELTPRVHTTSPTPSPSSSAKPLTLGLSIHRQLDSPLVSEERLNLLRAQVATLDQADDAPSHVHVHVIQPMQDGDVFSECPTPSPLNSKLRNSPPGSEDQNHTDQDVVTHTRDNTPAHANNLIPDPVSNRNPRTTTESVSQLL